MNYSSGYKNIYTATAGTPAYESVNSFTTVSLYGAYDLGEMSLFGATMANSQIALNIDNILDTAPPYSMHTGALCAGRVRLRRPAGTSDHLVSHHQVLKRRVAAAGVARTFP